MISQSGKTILQQFVTKTKDLLLKSTLASLQEKYGIWDDGHTIPVERLSTKDTDTIHVARMLRERMKHIINALPEETANKEKVAVGQLVAEQAFTVLNRFCALRMCEERDLIFETIRGGYNSLGFQSYDAVTGGGAVGSQYDRYQWYLTSIFDELSIELPAVFDRFSQFCLIFPDETTLLSLLDLINADNLTSFYDEQTGETTNFWKEDETIGWIYQYYNSLEERRKIREESSKPRNSREMAIRNQFFTPEYIVKFLTDNTLGRIWYEMTGGRSQIGEICDYLVQKPDEEIPQRSLKEPTEIRTLDPTCGSMHFGLYAYGLYEYIYLDAWDNQPTLLTDYRYSYTREEFRKLIPSLILEHNIYGCEIDPRALQMAALSLWLRAQRSYSEMGIQREERPLIKHSNLVLAEGMPGNKKMFNILLSEFEAPMQRLIRKIWDKMRFVGEAGLLIRMEKEIEKEIEDLRKNWYKVNRAKDLDMFSPTLDQDIEENEKAVKLAGKSAKEEFFAQVTDRLQDALRKISEQLSEEEGYENALFTEDASRGFAFIELCQQRFDVIVMNPPFGEGSEHSTSYLEENYSTWSGNLVCSFFIRMKELLDSGGLLGAIFDRSTSIRSSYEQYRKETICGYIRYCADTGEGVLDAQVETTTLVISNHLSSVPGVFFDVLKESTDSKRIRLREMINNFGKGITDTGVYVANSEDFTHLPNSIIGYYFDESLLRYFSNPTLAERGLAVRKGHDFQTKVYHRNYYECIDFTNILLMYNAGDFNMFYFPYYNVVRWKDDVIFNNRGCNVRNLSLQQRGMVGYGERGEIMDTHVLKKGFIFTQEGVGIPAISQNDAFALLSYLNSLLGHYMINKFCGQHKSPGYVSLLPMPSYSTKQATIESIISEIVSIRRKWFSIDETILEYRGLIALFNNSSFTSLQASLISLNEDLAKDYRRYEELKSENDKIWLSLSGLEEDADLCDSLSRFSGLRPEEELICINGLTINNTINRVAFAKEIVQELVGICFGRWDIDYPSKRKQLPAFDGIFEVVPFMPSVSLNRYSMDYPIALPADGILVESADNPLSIVSQIRIVLIDIWKEKASDVEYELCRILGVNSLQDFFDSPSGFFDYHFKRYTKARRKSPIYWPLSSANGAFTVWVYYPKLSQNTLPQIVLLLGKEIEAVKSELLAAQMNLDKVAENRLRLLLTDLDGMVTDLNAVIALPYRPNQDDGVPVTAAPLARFFQHTVWKNECNDNFNRLNAGEYDWSHLAFSMFPSRIREKAKRDWCMALTHGLEEICLNRPRERRARRSTAAEETNNLFE